MDHFKGANDRKFTKAGLGTEKGVPSLCSQASGPPDKHSVWHSVPGVTVAEWRSVPKAGLQVLALRPKGTFQGQGPIQEKEAGASWMDAVLVTGTGLTWGVGCEDLVPVPHFLQVSPPQSRPERFLVTEVATKQPAVSSVP